MTYSDAPLSLTYQHSDGLSKSNIGTIEITVIATNSRPAQGYANLQTFEEQLVDIRMLGFDLENDSLTFFITELPKNGQLYRQVDGSFIDIPIITLNARFTMT